METDAGQLVSSSSSSNNPNTNEDTEKVNKVNKVNKVKHADKSLYFITFKSINTDADTVKAKAKRKEFALQRWNCHS